MTTVNIKAHDSDTIYTLTQEQAAKSTLIQDILDTPLSHDSIIVLSVNDYVLSKVVTFLQNSTVLDLHDDEFLTSSPDVWDLQFFNMAMSDIVSVLKAAEFMIINSLIHLCCLFVARGIHANGGKIVCEHQSNCI